MTGLGGLMLLATPLTLFLISSASRLTMIAGLTTALTGRGSRFTTGYLVRHHHSRAASAIMHASGSLGAGGQPAKACHHRRYQHNKRTNGGWISVHVQAWLVCSVLSGNKGGG